MYFFKKNKGQSFLEGLVISIIITVFMFAAIQVCIMVVDDMYINLASFYATRAVSVTPNKKIANTAKKIVSDMLLSYNLQSTSVINYKTTHWNEKILGNTIKDHSDIDISKHNVKIGYDTKIMFSKLFNSTAYRHQSSRSRMIKSPDEKYYNKAYPDAKNFPIFK